MTVSSVAPGWVRVIALVAVVTGALVLGEIHGARRGAAAGAKLAEAAELRAKGFAVAADASQHDLNAKAAALSGLQGELARLKAASPGAQVIAVAQLHTSTVVASGTPRPTSPVSCVPPPQPAPLPPDPAPACLLAVGDRGDVVCNVAGVETRAGNTVAVGTGEAWRREPAPATRLLSAPFEADLSTLTVRAPERSPGWGLGVYGACSATGCAAGPAASLPPFRFWGHQLELSAGAAFVGNGLHAGLSLVMR